MRRQPIGWMLNGGGGGADGRQWEDEAVWCDGLATMEEVEIRRE